MSYCRSKPTKTMATAQMRFPRSWEKYFRLKTWSRHHLCKSQSWSRCSELLAPKTDNLSLRVRKGCLSWESGNTCSDPRLAINNKALFEEYLNHATTDKRSTLVTVKGILTKAFEISLGTEIAGLSTQINKILDQEDSDILAGKPR